MRIARVTGTLTASVKPDALTGVPLVIVSVEDGNGVVLTEGVVAADVVGAGPGDLVLIAEGSAARLSSTLASAAVDAAAIAIIDHIDLSGAGKPRQGRSSSQNRKS